MFEHRRNVTPCLVWALALCAMIIAIFVANNLYWRSHPSLVTIAPINLQPTSPLIEDVFDYRMQFNSDGAATLRNNLKLQGLVLLFAVLLLARAVKDNVVLFKIFRISSRTFALVELLLPVALLYLWMEFGYVFFDLIDNHKSLWHIIDAIDPTTATIAVNSAHRLQTDHFFILDVWFIVFDPTYVSVPRVDFLKLTYFKTIGVAVFLGALHAVTISLICDSYRRRASTRPIRICYWIYVFVVLVLLLATHIEFYDRGHKDNWGQILTLASTLILTYYCSTKLPTLHSNDR